MSIEHESVVWVNGKPTTPWLLGESVASRVPPVVCAECGRIDDKRGAWTMRLDCDGEPLAFCPACDRREFRE